VAIPTRIDNATYPSRTLGRRPIVLARLPYVGVEVGRGDLNVAGVQEPVILEPETHVSSNHFVDPGHPPSGAVPALLPAAPREETSNRSSSHRQKKRVSKSQQSRSATSFRQQRQPTGLSAILFSAHYQMAPFAGVIVTLALIASAGLLYWMIVSPSRVSTDLREVSQEGFGASAVELPRFVPELSSFSSRTKATNIPETRAFELPSWDSDEVLADASPAPLDETPVPALQEQELVVSIEEPAVGLPTERTLADVSEQTTSAVEKPTFLTTSSPTALDFSKIGAVANVESKEDLPRSQPRADVAGLAVPHVVVPTRR